MLNQSHLEALFPTLCDGQVEYLSRNGSEIEIATTQPGFLVDQSADRLGKDPMLPPWSGPERAKTEATVPPMGTDR